MNDLKAIWRWLSVKNNLVTLTLLCSVLAALVGGLWQVYLHISEKTDTKPMQTVSATNGGIAVAGNNTITATKSGTAVQNTGSGCYYRHCS